MTDIWGKYIWQTMHYIALGYPDNPTNDKKEKYKQFYTLFKDVLPCSICTKHYEQILINYPLTDDIMNNKDKLIKWTIDIHNIVNESLHKKNISYDEASNVIYKYSNHNIYNDNNNDNNDNYINYYIDILYYYLIILLIIYIIIVIYKISKI
jgi:hypothetical protein